MDVLRLSSEGGVVDFHFVGRDEAHIAGDIHAVVDDDDVSGNNLLRGNFGLSSVSDDGGDGRDEVLELSHHVGGLGRLAVGEHSGDKGNCCQHDSQVEVSLVGVVEDEPDEAKG